MNFAEWLTVAPPGERFEYYRGELGYDAQQRDGNKNPTPQAAHAAYAGPTAYKAYRSGLVHLVQRRLAPHRFAYIAVKRNTSPTEAPKRTKTASHHVS